MKKNLFVVMFLTIALGLFSTNVMAQSVSATYTEGDIPTDSAFTFLPGASGEPGVLTVTIPEDVVIIGVDVVYNMTAQNGAWMGEQRSQLRCVSPDGEDEATLSSGSGNLEGTYSYNRTGLTIANNVSGGGDIVFELHAGRTWSTGGHSGISTYNNKVDDGTWTVTVHYLEAGAPESPSNPNPENLASGVSVNTAINWEICDDTEEVQVLFGTVNPPVDVVYAFDTAVTSLANLDIGGPLEHMTTYYWQVTARNDAGEINSPVWRFTTEFPEGLVEIGDGTVTSLHLPLNTNWGYNYSQVIYYRDEINVEDMRIEKLYYYWNGWQAGTYCEDWVVYMGHTDKVEFENTSDWIPIEGLTQVFAGVLDIPAEEGWIEITLQNPFIYNNIDNLVIAVNEITPGFGATAAAFLGTSTDQSRGIMVRRDSPGPYDPANPPTATAIPNGIANIMLQFGDLPDEPVFSVNPEEHDFGTVIINTPASQIFTITNTGGATLDVNSISVTGNFFDLVVDPTPVGLGPGVSANFTVEYLPEAEGIHTGNIAISYVDGSFDIPLEGDCLDPTLYAPHDDFFDGVTAPALPLGWSKYVQHTSTFAVVETNTTASPLTPPNHIRMYNSFSSDPQGQLYLITPLASNIAENRIRFFAKVNNTVTAPDLIVGTMNDPSDPATFEAVSTIEGTDMTTAYQEFTVAFDGLGRTDTHIAFYHGDSHTGSGRSIFIDNFRYEAIPDEPIFSVNPEEHDFGLVEIGTVSSSQTFILSNIGGGNLVLQPEDIWIDETDFFLLTNIESETTLGPGASTTIEVSFQPAAEDFYEGTLFIDHGIEGRGLRVTRGSRQQASNRVTTEVPLSGEGYFRPAGSTCLNPLILELPIIDYFDNTIDYGNDYGTNWVTPSSNYLGGNDFVVQFTLEEAGFLSGGIVSPAGSWTGLHIVDGCPNPEDPADVLVFRGGSSGGNPFSDFEISAGTYFAIVSTWPSPNHAEFTLNLSFVPLPEDPEFDVNPWSHDFGSVLLDTTTEVQDFVISNIGGGTITINPEDIVIEVLEGTEEEFILTNIPSTVNLEYGETAIVGVQFAPLTPGPKSAQLKIEDNIPALRSVRLTRAERTQRQTGQREEQIVALTGEGIEPLVINTFPWTEDFEEITFPPFGWERETVTGINQWTRSTDQSYSGNASAFINWNTNFTDNYLISPPIESTEDIQVVFYLRKQFSGTFPPDDLEIRVSTTDTDPESFVHLLETIDVANLPQNEWHEFTVDLDDFTGGEFYLAFRHIQTDGNGVWLDDVTFQKMPTVIPPEGGEITIGDVTVIVNHDAGTDIEYNPAPIDPPALPEGYESQLLFSVTGPPGATVIFTFGPTDIPFGFFYLAEWSPAIPNDWSLGDTGNIVMEIEFPLGMRARSEVFIMLGDPEEEPPLPVELSSFTASITSNLFVRLQWITASETNMLGYNVYRNTENNLEDAVKVNPIIIEASNSSSQQKYDFIDEDVEIEMLYYYWLQATELNLTSELHGPISILVTEEEEDIPGTPYTTELIGAYPNPFNPDTRIAFTLAEESKVTITVYNTLGQVIRTIAAKERFSAGSNSVVWDGRDQSGRYAGSGIYFYRMDADIGYSMIKKMALIK